MDPKFWLTASLLIIGLVSSTLAQASQTEQEALIDEVLKLSGVETTLRMVGSLVENKLAEYKSLYESQPVPKNISSLDSAVKESFRADALYASLKAHLAKNFNAAHMAAVSKALRAPLIKKMTQLEMEAASPAVLTQRSLYEIQISKKPPSPEINAVVDRVDAGKGITDLAVEMQIAIMQELSRLVEPFLPPGRRTNNNDLAEIANLMRTQYRTEVKKNTRACLLYAYRSVSKKELQGFVEFIESGSARWFHETLKRGFMAAVNAASARCGEKIAKSLPQKKQST